MEFIIYSDMHYSLGVSRSYIRSDGMYSWLYEQLEVTNQIFDYARENNVKWVIHNGDFFDDKNKINVGLYNTIWDVYKKLSEEFYIIFNIGNHDVSSLLESSLRPFSDIGMIVGKHGYIRGGDRDDDIDEIRIIPYSNTIGNLGVKAGKKNVLIIHEEIAGLILGPTDYESGSSLKHQILEDWDLVLNGHIHKPQTLKNIINIGSPMPKDWGEAGEEKRFIHYKDGEAISVPLSGIQFIAVRGLTPVIRAKIEGDNRNFYRIDVADDPKDEIFHKYNVSYGMVKTKKREIRLDNSGAMTKEEELREYIKIKDPDLDHDKLLQIGLEAMK